MKTNSRNYVQALTISGVLLSVGILLPRLFHIFGTQELGKMFLPMHISVFIAGIFMGKYYGLWIGFLTPLLNSFFGMPMFPINILMACELAAYGYFSGLFYMHIVSDIKIFGKDIRVYISLLVSMFLGRVVYALGLWVTGQLLGMKVPKPLSIWVSTVAGIPGILIQLVLVPVIVYALKKLAERQ